MRRRCLLLFAAAVVCSAAACAQREDLAGDAVRVQWSDRRIELEVISCGLDDDVFVLGAASADSFVQLLLVTDGEEVDRERSAVSVEVDPAGALGAGSAALLGVEPGVPGEITSATIRGDRIDVEADARMLDSAGAQVVSIEIEGRCPAVEGFV